MYRDNTRAVATAAERMRECDEMKEGERHRKRPEGRANSRSVFA